MLEAILKFSIERAKLVFLAVLALAALGIWNFNKLSIDAVPDITNVQVTINTEVAGLTPLEIEQRVTFPLETALAGMPKLSYTRSISRYGLSQVVAIFDDGIDIFFARQLVSERLNAAQSELPVGAEPQLGPTATGLGEIFMFTVDAIEGATNEKGEPVDATYLRTVHDWIIKPQLMQVDGVVEVNPNGGFERQILITLEPDKLLGAGLTPDAISQAVLADNQNQGAGFIEKNGAQYLVRLQGQVSELAELENIDITNAAGQYFPLSQVANIKEGVELRSGAATQDGREVVMSTVMMLIGENSQQVAKAVGAKLEVIQTSLPNGVVINPVYDRTELVNKTLATVKTNLIEGALLVVVILFLLLGNIRAAILTALVIPLAMLMTVTGMVQNRVSANLMSLGALDFGLLVDGAIIIVENCLRRLSESSRQNNAATLALKVRLALVFSATREVIRPALFGVFIITAVYLPIFALEGTEGKMFHPMAFTVVTALVCAMVLSITFVPAAIAFFFKKPVKEKPNPIVSTAEKLYRPLLSLALKARWIVVTAAVALVLSTGYMGAKLGSEFIPNLDEGDIAMHALRIPGTSLSQSVEMQKSVEQAINQLDEVERVFSKIGTPDVATDPMPPSVADTFIMLKPQAEWPDATKSKAELIEEIEAAVEQIPGNRYEFSQPIQMRFNELLAGVRSELAIKVFGDDQQVLAQTAESIRQAIASIDGIRDLGVEQVTGLPVLTLIPNKQAMARYGVTLVEVQHQVANAMGGQRLGKLYQGDKRFDIVLRLDEDKRHNLDYLSRLPIFIAQANQTNAHIPLQELVDIQLIEGANQVNRENGKRRIVVTANVRERDLGRFVADVKQVIAQKVDVPAGYWLEYGGTYQKLSSASERLLIVVPLTLAIIITLLLLALGSFKDSLIIFSGVPLALTGGILALIMRDIPFSISAAVGFIALSGIAILNGLVMVSFIRDLVKQKLALEQAIIQGALTRLRPVITTALVASLGFIPMAFNTGMGAEVQRPLATVVIGGVVSSTLLTLFVLPALYRLLHKDKR
ncbi:CusA/CzcA family heavy metal efflux RND transporter [Catenovulum sp. SM1970]|uniref:efflux RND transporter permease subunit n=1 Tax=Marinifaba aquimaris TaxID=2741323 RepID=UPI0015732E3C|nr:CusA/CzcA family heavy metal efflux RND transporter [Marinifaba aquimaris]NTS77198.1 CusA/CzcA family heavy metal efflux RND transporter [Marinifaba aquimaris]